MGGEDGEPKTPKWAEGKCGVPARQIKALARYWAKHNVTTAHCNGGGYIRSVFAHEPARLEIALLAMQGVGAPGRNMFKMMEWGLYGMQSLNPLPHGEWGTFMFAAYTGHVAGTDLRHFVPQTLVPDAIMLPEGEKLLLVRARGGRPATRRPVPALRVSHGGRQPHPHDLDRHALLVHLLERRQPHAGRAAPRVHRVLPGAAPLDGERHAVRRRHPAHQHEARRGRHRHVQPMRRERPDRQRGAGRRSRGGGPLGRRGGARHSREAGPARPADGALVLSGHGGRQQRRQRGQRRRLRHRDQGGQLEPRVRRAFVRHAQEVRLLPRRLRGARRLRHVLAEGLPAHPLQGRLARRPGGHARVLRGPGSPSPGHADRQDRVLLHGHQRLLGQRRRAPASPPLDRGKRRAPRAPDQRARQGLSVPGGVERIRGSACMPSTTTSRGCARSPCAR